MTKEEFLAAVRQYGHYRASDLADDAARKLDEITKAVDAHWWHDPHGAKLGRIVDEERPTTKTGRIMGADRPPLQAVPGSPAAAYERMVAGVAKVAQDVTEAMRKAVGYEPPPPGLLDYTTRRRPESFQVVPQPTNYPRQPCGCPFNTEHVCNKRCSARHDVTGFGGRERCVRDAGHVKPWGRAPATWRGGDVPIKDETLAVLGPDEHMDDKGNVWK